MKVSPGGFGEMTRVLLDIANRCCGGKFAVTLEGGYHIAGIAESAKVVLNEMCGETCVTEAQLAKTAGDASSSIDTLIGTVIGQIKPFWPVF